MEADFWHARWSEGRIGFHEAEGNALLQRHFPALGLAPGARVFVPLSGKTRDIGWLLSQGFRVVAAELSEIAIRDLFADLGLAPQVRAAGAMSHWSAPGLDVFVGDVFDLDAGTLGPVDAVLDRAALIALPDGIRGRYARHIAEITQAAPILLVTFEYPEGAITGPPFSVSEAEARATYASTYRADVLESAQAWFRGGVAAQEHALLLRRF